MAKSWKRADLLINPELEIKSARFSAHLVLPEEMDAFFPPLFQLCVRFAERAVLDHFIVLDQSSVRFLECGISHFDRCKNRNSDNPWPDLQIPGSCIDAAHQARRRDPCDESSGQKTTRLNPSTPHPHDPLTTLFPSWLSTAMWVRNDPASTFIDGRRPPPEDDQQRLLRP